MANVNSYNTHFQETIKMSKAQSKIVRNLLTLNLPIKDRVNKVKSYITDRFQTSSINLINNINELIVRVGAPDGLPTTYYFKYTSYKKA